MSNFCQCPLMGMVLVRLQVPTLSPWALYSPTCGVLALPKVDLPALAHSTWLLPSTPVFHWVGVTAKYFFFFFFCKLDPTSMYICVCYTNLNIRSYSTRFCIAMCDLQKIGCSNTNTLTDHYKNPVVVLRLVVCVLCPLWLLYLPTILSY